MFSSWSGCNKDRGGMLILFSDKSPSSTFSSSFPFSFPFSTFPRPWRRSCVCACVCTSSWDSDCDCGILRTLLTNKYYNSNFKKNCKVSNLIILIKINEQQANTIEVKNKSKFDRIKLIEFTEMNIICIKNTDT